jgi:hypothetical protein
VKNITIHIFAAWRTLHIDTYIVYRTGSTAVSILTRIRAIRWLDKN